MSKGNYYSRNKQRIYFDLPLIFIDATTYNVNEIKIIKKNIFKNVAFIRIIYAL